MLSVRGCADLVSSQEHTSGVPCPPVDSQMQVSGGIAWDVKVVMFMVPPCQIRTGTKAPRT